MMNTTAPPPLAGPPSDADREARDIEFTRLAQERWCNGFHARQSESQPTVEVGRTKKGRPKKKMDPRASLAHLAEDRCWEKRAEMRERWIAGFLFADSICVTYGHAELMRRDPARPRRVRRTKVAEPVEMFPEAVLTKMEARERRFATHQRGFL